MDGKRHRSRAPQRGHAVVEVALLSPWIFLLFIGIFDFGFYAYAVISTANAARVAAVYTSSGPSTLANSHGACLAALEEMRALPNIKNAVNCPACDTPGAACTAGPVEVTATELDAANSPDGVVPATRVQVRYQTVPVMPLPWFAAQRTITRTAWMRGRS